MAAEKNRTDRGTGGETDGGHGLTSAQGTDCHTTSIQHTVCCNTTQKFRGCVNRVYALDGLVTPGQEASNSPSLLPMLWPFAYYPFSVFLLPALLAAGQSNHPMPAAIQGSVSQVAGGSEDRQPSVPHRFGIFWRHLRCPPTTCALYCDAPGCGHPSAQGRDTGCGSTSFFR
jgi:hypothetical protein